MSTKINSVKLYRQTGDIGFVVLYLFCRFAPFHCVKFCKNGYGLLTNCLFILLAMDGFQHFGHKLHLEFGHNRKDIAVEMHRVALVKMVFDADLHLSLSEANGLTAEVALFAMDKAGIDKANIWLQPPYMRVIDEANHYIYQSAKKHPDRFNATGWVDPHFEQKNQQKCLPAALKNLACTASSSMEHKMATVLTIPHCSHFMST